MSESITHEGKEFRKIPGYNFYYISRCGFVLSTNSNQKNHIGKTKRILNTWLTNKGIGYYYFVVCENKFKKTLMIHREVLNTFIGPAKSGFEASHIDGNCHNNNLHNLKWQTHKENMKNRSIHGTHGQKLNDKDVLNIREKYNGKNRLELAELYSVHKITIVDVVKRRTWKHI